MPGTFHQILLHVVFSTKHRIPFITEDLSKRLYPYMGGIIRNENAVLYDINGIEDHVHLYMRIRPDMELSDLMRDLKSGSSLWVHQTFPKLQDFQWQEGYWAFSLGKAQEEPLKTYIANQREHHKKEDFKTEIIRLLHEEQIEFDERYLFD